MSWSLLPSCIESYVQTFQLAAGIALVDDGVIIVNKSLFHIVTILVRSCANARLRNARERYALCVWLVDEEGMTELAWIVVGWRLLDYAEHVCDIQHCFHPWWNQRCLHHSRDSRSTCQDGVSTLLKVHHGVRPCIHVMESASQLHREL
jgi:hypothetical protein